MLHARRHKGRRLSHKICLPHDAFSTNTNCLSIKYYTFDYFHPHNNFHIANTINFAQQPKVVARGARLMVSSGGREHPPNARFALRSHRVLCAQIRHQRQKFRTQCAELLEEFRGQARVSSMRAHCRTQKRCLFLFIDFLILY